MPTHDEAPRHPPPRMPNTLSLPSIPKAPMSAPPSRRPDASYPRADAPRRTPELWPSPDAWDDDDPSALETDYAVQTRDLVAVSSRSLVAATSAHQRALGPLASRHLSAPPPRPLRRTLVIQGVLALLVVFLLIASVRGSATPAAAYASAFQGNVSAHTDTKVVDLVPIQTQIDPTIGYDSPAQYKQYSDASCGAASTSSVLLAWGDPKGRIGQVIDDMIPHLQPIGMVDPAGGFNAVAQKHGFNVIISDSVTLAQLRQIVTDPGIPVVVGIRDTNGGYYSYFAPGHFLVIVGADANGFKVVDNSTYFVHYFPTATFLQLWTAPHAVIFSPKSFTFHLP
jgi:predicted double-glycine peptidase